MNEKRSLAATSDQSMTLLLIDDDPLAIDALEIWLEAIGDVTLHSVWGDQQQLIDAYEVHRPDAVLIDLLLTRNGPDGLHVAGVLEQHDPASTRVIITSSESSEDATNAWRAGITGYLLKQRIRRHVHSLPGLLRRIIQGSVVYDVDPRPGPPRDDKLATLSARELEVLRSKASGLTHREIADELCLSVRTVDSHLANARAKLGRDRMQEALDLARNGGGWP